jgi:hypothetical protein
MAMVTINKGREGPNPDMRVICKSQAIRGARTASFSIIEGIKRVTGNENFTKGNK